MATVSPIRTPQLSAVLYTITTIHVSSLSTMPNVLQEKKIHNFFSPRSYQDWSKQHLDNDKK